jgi:hypothetical protein
MSSPITKLREVSALAIQPVVLPFLRNKSPPIPRWHLLHAKSPLRKVDEGRVLGDLNGGPLEVVSDADHVERRAIGVK